MCQAWLSSSPVEKVTCTGRYGRPVVIGAKSSQTLEYIYYYISMLSSGVKQLPGSLCVAVDFGIPATVDIY